MQKIAVFFYKILRRTLIFFIDYFDYIITLIILYVNNASFQKIKCKGIPYVRVEGNGILAIGNNFKMNNNIRSNPIGRVERCIIIVKRNATLVIGNQVGMSSAALVSHHKIEIGNHVKIGGGVCIYDTDFHTLNPEFRKNYEKDRDFKKSLPVFIGDNVFIGAHSTILKGVSIGENSIIGACSVVTKNIPANEIWAGNPARLIKKLEKND